MGEEGLCVATFGIFEEPARGDFDVSRHDCSEVKL